MPSKISKYLVIFSVLTLMTSVLFESAGILVAYLAGDGWFYDRGSKSSEPNRRHIMNTVFHPYFGYVLRPVKEPFHVTAWSPLPLTTSVDGFPYAVGDKVPPPVNLPYKAKPSEVIVAITGGSVAQ